MRPVEQCRIGITGLGLMGGAIARALRKAGAAKDGGIFACDTCPQALDAALAEGLIDEGLVCGGDSFNEEKLAALLARADLVYLCLNPAALLRFLRRNMNFFRNGALITDVAGIKGRIAATAEKELRPDLDFIPGHPMAGAEKGGFAHSGLVDFSGRNYILTPLRRSAPENVAWLRDLILRMGFGRVTETTPEDHDRKIAFTSQLCHVIAAALVDCQNDTGITRFGGGSFEDLTRIAMLNAPLWTELFIENRAELLQRIEQFEGSLEKIKNLIAAAAEEDLLRTLQEVRNRRSEMG